MDKCTTSIDVPREIWCYIFRMLANNCSLHKVIELNLVCKEWHQAIFLAITKIDLTRQRLLSQSLAQKRSLFAQRVTSAKPPALIFLHKSKMEKTSEISPKFVNLKELAIEKSRNSDTQLTVAINTAQNLEKLIMDCSTILPNAMSHFTHLNHLELRYVDLPIDYLQHMTRLQQLYMEGGEFTCLPTDIKWLTHLTDLVVRRTLLESIPKEIAGLTNLTIVILAHNKINELPSEIGQCTNITELNVSHNQITEIPQELAKLHNLTRLVLNSNRITHIPDCLQEHNLPKLHTFLIASNPVTNTLPAWVLNKSNPPAYVYVPLRRNIWYL